MKNRKTRWASLFLFFILLFLSAGSLFACGELSLKEISQNLTSYNLDLNFNESDNSLEAVEKVRYVNNYETTLNCVKFHLYPNSFRQGATYSPVSLRNYEKAYPNGFSAGQIEISSVKVENKSIDVKIEGNDENILSVDLFEEIFPDDIVLIEICFEVLLPNCIHRFGYGENTYNFGNFYPVACVFEKGEFVQDNYGSNGDPFYSESANYNVKITCDDDFIMASTGAQTEKIEENGKKLQKYLLPL